MSISSIITVEFGDKAGLNDITDRVQGAQITSRVRSGDFGINKAVITLRNDDGALTPGAGGTYTNVDWFSQGLFIEGDTGTYTYTLFHGIITDFIVRDNGVNSVIEIQADDGYTVGGSSATDIDITGIVSGDLDYWLGIIYNGYSTGAGTISGVQMPLLANTNATVTVTPVGIADGASGAQPATNTYSTVAPARDFARTVLMPSNPNVGWPTTIELSTSTTTYNAAEANIYPVRSSSTAIEFTFDESPTAGKLPFVNLVRGYPIDSMLNSAVISSIDNYLGTPQTATATNVESTQKYGTRAFQATSVMVGTGDTSSPGSVESIAARWANTFSSAEFVVQSFEVNESIVNAEVGSSATSEEKWAQLLDVSTGPIQNATITFTPAGSSTAITETFVTMSRTIQITPSDIRLRVECLPIDQTGAFVLDSDVLGVLDQNRLG